VGTTDRVSQAGPRSTPEFVFYYCKFLFYFFKKKGFRDQLAKDVDQVFWRLRAVRTTRSMFAKFIDPKLPPGTPLLRHLLQSIFHLVVWATVLFHPLIGKQNKKHIY